VLGFHLTPAIHALEKIDVRVYMLRDALRNYRPKQIALPPPKPFAVPTLYVRRYIRDTLPNYVPKHVDVLGSTYKEFSDD
jgi:hypothetical protein